MIKICLFLLLVCSLIGGHSLVWADAPRQSNLSFGDTAEGNISNSQFRQLYSFEGRAGQVITVRMVRETGNLDPYLLLLTQNGDLVAASDDEDGRNAEMPSQSLPITGIYTIIATRFGHEHGTTEGDYTLTLDAIGSVVAGSEATTNPNADSSSIDSTTPPQLTTSFLSYGDEVFGQITSQQAYVIYRFAAQRGDVVNLAMARINGDLDPLLDLFDPDGNYLVSGDDDEFGTLNAAISNYTIPRDGVYYLQATRYGRIDGTTTGLYVLSIGAVPIDELGTRPSNARVLAIPSITSSNLSDETLIRFFQIEAQRGDILSVVVTRTSGDWEPEVTLLNSDLSEMASSILSDEADIATIGGVTVQSEGIYFVSVTRTDNQDTAIEDEFLLQVQSRPSLAMEAMLEIVYDGQVIGTINNTNSQESFVFAGQAGDVVTISMIRTNGDLDALLTLRDIEGKQLAVNDDGYGSGVKDARISDFQLPADGVYFIEASRYQRAAGNTSGDYVLQLSAIPIATQN